MSSAVIVGAGIGGLALGIRLAAMGVTTTIVEKLHVAGGRGAVLRQDGFVFDMGPTVLTVPHFIEELFALQPGDPGLDGEDFPESVLNAERTRTGKSGGEATREYIDLRAIKPFYRIVFDDGTYFDYDGDIEHTKAQIREICPADVQGYERFLADAGAIFRRGFLDLGYTHFGDVASMLAVAPDLIRLDAVRSLFSFTSRYFQSHKLQQVFSFEPLLVGGNPLRVPAIYAMIHFVESTWGVHYAMGGTGALVAALVKKFEELGGELRLEAPAAQILLDQTHWLRRPTATGVELASGEVLHADLVVSNADYGFTYGRLVPSFPRKFNNRVRRGAMRWSMSLVVLYFGFRIDDEPLDLVHHNILLGPRYEELLREIFDTKTLAEDFSQYLHVPTLTDPSLAPEGCHAAYTLVPVPHNGSSIDWSVQGPRLRDAVFTYLEERGFIPRLRERLVTEAMVTPDYFEHMLSATHGNGFGVEPTLTQSAFFRPHNRSEDVHGLYLVGASAQPGGGTPSVMMSAKMTARLIREDLGR